jgi:hypothetical protein
VIWQGVLREKLRNDKVTCADINSSSLAFGTEEGHVHVVSISKRNVQSFKCHNRRVNGVSMDSHGLVVGR